MQIALNFFAEKIEIKKTELTNRKLSFWSLQNSAKLCQQMDPFENVQLKEKGRIPARRRYNAHIAVYLCFWPGVHLPRF
jgi:hypothetical protein